MRRAAGDRGRLFARPQLSGRSVRQPANIVMMRSILLATALAITSCAVAQIESQDEGWPPEADDSCWNNDAAQDYLKSFINRSFSGWLRPDVFVRFVIASDGTVARWELEGATDAELSAKARSAFKELDPIPVPPEAQCVSNVTLTGVLASPDQKVTPLEQWSARPVESLVLDAVVTQLFESVNLPDGSRVVRALIEVAQSDETGEHQISVMCSSPPSSNCPSTVGESGTFSLSLEPTEGRWLVEQYEPRNK